MKELWLTLLLAALLWLLIFSPWTSGRVNFWLALSFSAGLLAGWALLRERGRLLGPAAWRPGFILAGIGGAALLYFIFFAGQKLAPLFIPDSAGQITRIYHTRRQLPLPAIGLLLLLIAPAEELYWRGYAQPRLVRHLGILPGLVAGAAVYSLVHVWAGNPLLLIAAMVCGLVWGGMALWFRSLWPGLISHTVWDLAIFVVFPLGG